MTEVQKILTCLANCLHDNQISEDECLGVLKAMRGIPPEKHMDAFMAFIGADQEQQEERPEDYLAVKTYESPTLGIGDEVIAHDGRSAVIISIGNTYMSVLYADQTIEMLPISACINHRTGRNFPAIPAILEELKKGVDKSAETL